MKNNAGKLKTLINKLKIPSIDNNDLKALSLAIITDMDDNSVPAARAKIEALKLLIGIIADENGAKEDESSEIEILQILSRKKRTEGDK